MRIRRAAPCPHGRCRQRFRGYHVGGTTSSKTRSPGSNLSWFWASDTQRLHVRLDQSPSRRRGNSLPQVEPAVPCGDGGFGSQTPALGSLNTGVCFMFRKTPPWLRRMGSPQRAAGPRDLPWSCVTSSDPEAQRGQRSQRLPSSDLDPLAPQAPAPSPSQTPAEDSIPHGRTGARRMGPRPRRSELTAGKGRHAHPATASPRET